MGHRFVSLNHGERDIHWLRLGGFAVLTFILVSAIVELAWYCITGHWSNEALLVAGFLSTLIAIRSLLRACSIPERDLDPASAKEALPPQRRDSISAAV